MTRFRSVGSIASVVALVGGMLLVTVPPVAAATCEVTNAATGTSYTTLQEAVDDAASGDTLEVRGTCVGKTVIRATRLRLKGIPTTEQPTPTLDGAQLSQVLTVLSAKVVIRDLTVTNGKAKFGGGILADRDRGAGAARPRVTLSGDTSVTGNAARYSSGGVYNYRGTLTLNDSSSVTGNTARYRGGGIDNLYGDLTLNDSASVTGNTAGGGGGGIINYGTLTLNDSASVTGNTAESAGGGIENSGTLTLNDSASVSGNTTEWYGGGIANGEFGTLILSDSASVTGNTAGGGGGGIINYGGEFGTLILSDSASVTGNTAKEDGGGIYTVGYHNTLILNDSASVTGNTAKDEGGGVYNDPDYPGRVYVCSDEVAISPNDPDDPPKVRHVCL